MTSKEALRNLKNFIGYNSPYNKDLDIIKQDLERLEVLEKENQELNENAVSLAYENAGYQITIEDYEIENVDLREENEKLKKAIEIIKTKRVDIDKLLYINNFREYNKYLTFKLDGITYLKGVSCKLTQQEYELLKEVLGDA